MSSFFEEPIKILHLDDEPDTLTISEKFLKRFSDESKKKIDYTGISNPSNFFSSIVLNKFDVAVVDYEMPGITGLEILHKLRNEYNNDLPLIIFTGRGREEVAINALNLGANYYIRKGLDFESQYRELFHSIESVVKQKRTELAFYENEKKYRGLVENLPIIVLIMDKKGIINYANHVTSPYTVEQVIGNPFFDYLIEEDIEKAKKLFDQAIENKTIARGEFRTKIDNILDVQYIPMHSDEEITEIMAIIDVISERKKMEDSLKSSEERFRLQFKFVPIPAYLWKKEDEDFVLIDFNKLAEDITRGEVENFIKSKMSEMYKEKPDIIEDFFLCFNNKTVVRRKMEYEFIMSTEKRFFNVYYSFVPPDLIAVYTEDISEQERAREELKQSEEKFRSLFEQTPIAQAERDYSEVINYFSHINARGILDLENYLKTNPEEVFTCAKKIKLTLVNQAALDLFEVSSKAEFLELIPLKYLHQEKPFNAFIKQLVNIYRGELKQSNGVQFFTGKGRSIYLNIVHTVPDEHKKSFKRVWTKYIDVTELKQSQLKLENMEKSL